MVIETAGGVPGLTQDAWPPRKVSNYAEASSSEPDSDGEPKARGDRPERPAKRRRKSLKPDQEAFQLEAETAIAVDLEAFAIMEEEEELLPSGHGSEALYYKVRNYVLAKWRTDVSQYLSEEDVVGGLAPPLHRYARAAWRFLDTSGLINFGVAPALLQRAAAAAAEPRGTVIIVGAGLAGLAAAQHLRKLGFRPLVLEGHARPGGRVRTVRMQGGGACAVADLGGSVLTGIDGNPLAVLARQLRIPLCEIEDKAPIYLRGGEVADSEADAAVDTAWNRGLDECDELRSRLGAAADCVRLETALRHFWEKSDERNSAASDPAQAELRERLFQWHVANLEFASAATADELALGSWDQDDPHEAPGAHCFLPGGNIRLVAALARGLDIVYNSRVARVAYSAEGVAVATDSHVFKGDAVLVTAPLGVLKAGLIRFQPPLPERKQAVIKRLGFGLLNKIVLLFPRAFWGDQTFARLAETGEERGEFYLFYSYAGISGGAQLTALVAGRAAAKFEKVSCDDATRRVMGVLRGIFEPKGVVVPAPLSACVTRWGADELARGIYSSMAVGSTGGDYDLLEENVSGRVFFAGEATNKMFPATMHGAFLSGLREAANIAASMGRASEPAQAPAEAEAAAAPKRGCTPADPQAAAEVARAEAAEAEGLARQLAAVFEDPHQPPEVEFGSFAAVAGPPGAATAGMWLLRVAAGTLPQAHQRLHLYLSIDGDDLRRLQDAEGGLEAQLRLLQGLPGARLLGRPTAALELARAILRARGLPTIETANDQAAAAPAV